MPLSSRGMTSVDGNFLSRFNVRDDKVPLALIGSGDFFTLTTKEMPLPDYNLLDLQWVMQRVLAMRGGAEPRELDDSDDDDTMLAEPAIYPQEVINMWFENRQRIRGWSNDVFQDTAQRMPIVATMPVA